MPFLNDLLSNMVLVLTYICFQIFITIFSLCSVLNNYIIKPKHFGDLDLNI